MSKTFVGVGFGPIQAGLFLYEAFSSGNFNRFVVAEVMPDVVKAIREGKGTCWVNIAGENGVEARLINNIEIFNPNEEGERRLLVEALAGADEIATALPSVSFYMTGGAMSVAALLADGIRQRLANGRKSRAVIYAAENHNHAAEILSENMASFLGDSAREAGNYVQCLNTVIGKMSGVVTDESQISEQKLKRVSETGGRCFLVEKFNRILISKIRWPDFRRGITVFEEKADLLPFEEAKLYGHNATHALIGYLARRKKYRFISDVANDRELLRLAREAFINESGGALCHKYRGLDELFTPAGYAAYADDLLKRMLNPHLRDAVERVVRDPRRKLGWDDRLIGTMRLALREGINPERYALGAKAALEMLSETDNKDGNRLLEEIWNESKADRLEKERIKGIINQTQLGAR
jgi:mannitol-1-phosphate 5-dehydrogenase